MCAVAAGPASAQGRTDENHFRCYIVSRQTPQPAEAVTLEDQFTTDPVPVMVGEPVMICPPTAKTVGEETFPIEDEQEHYVVYTAPALQPGREGARRGHVPDRRRGTPSGLLRDPRELACYEIHGNQKTQQFTVGVKNQFETDTFRTGPWEILCAPSEKTLPAS